MTTTELIDSLRTPIFDALESADRPGLAGIVIEAAERLESPEPLIVARGADGYIRYEARPGSNIQSVSEFVTSLIRRVGLSVEFNFNGRRLTCKAGADPETIQEAYWLGSTIGSVTVKIINP